MDTMPSNLTTGVKVHDSEDRHIGDIDDLHMSEVESENAAGPATGEPPATLERGAEARAGALTDAFARAFAPEDELPDEVQDRLWQQGYARVDTKGLFSSDRYITPDQIASFDGKVLRLNVKKDALIKR